MIRLTHGTVDIWWAWSQDASPHLEGMLDNTEKTRYLAYRAVEDRQRFLTGCVLSKLVVAHYLGCEASEIRFSRRCPRCGKPHGKPEIKGSPIRFSLSHSGDIVGIAATINTNIGLDVEHLGYNLDFDSIASLMLSSNELTMKDEYTTIEDFLVVWTRKEAITKAIGLGFQIPPTAVEVSWSTENPRLLAWPLDTPPETVSLFDVDVVPGYVSSLATLGPCRTINYRTGSSLIATIAGI